MRKVLLVLALLTLAACGGDAPTPDDTAGGTTVTPAASTAPGADGPLGAVPVPAAARSTTKVRRPRRSRPDRARTVQVAATSISVAEAANQTAASRCMKRVESRTAAGTSALTLTASSSASFAVTRQVDLVTAVIGVDRQIEL